MDKQELQNLFFYKNGELYWKKYRPGVNMGIPAGCVDKTTGYRQIRINKKRYYAHHLIYIYHYGSIQKGMEIDHKDHNRANNEIINLKLVTHKQNGKNCSIPKNNKSGVLGVSWQKTAKKWQVHLAINGKSKYFGLYENIKDAKKAIEKAKKKYNYHPNHGK